MPLVILKMHTKSLNPTESLFCFLSNDVAIAKLVYRHKYNGNIFVLCAMVTCRKPLFIFTFKQHNGCWYFSSKVKHLNLYAFCGVKSRE